MERIKKPLKEKCKKIRMVLADVDGVLTDGGRFYSQNGETLKKFHTRDGMGINILRRNGIKTGIISKDRSPIVKKWAKDMNVSFVCMGIIQKEKELFKIAKRHHLTNDEIAYIGDDVNDVELMRRVGLSATPQDGTSQTKQVADYICKVKAGDGAFRELTDLILSIKFPTKTKWY